MSKEKTIYDLKLHEQIKANDYTVGRVPGGWIYAFKSTMNVVFVPFHNEFQSQKTFLESLEDD